MNVLDYDREIIKSLNLQGDIKEVKEKLLKEKDNRSNVIKEYLSFRKLYLAMLEKDYCNEKAFDKMKSLAEKLKLKVPERKLKKFGSEKEKKKECFSIFLTERLSKARKKLNLQSVPKKDPLMTFEETFLNLNMQKIVDNDCEEESTFVTKNQMCLMPHSTSRCFTDGRTNYLDYFKVYRRQNVDKTHLAEFYQIQYSKIYHGEDPLKELVKDFFIIFSFLGLDCNNIEYKYTRNAYTYPSLEFYYKKEEKVLEIANSGVMDPLVVSKHKIETKGYVLAGALGAERAYNIAFNSSLPLRRIKNDLQL